MSAVADSAARPLGRGGLRVGPYGFGAAPLASLGHVVSDTEARGALEAAWARGIRYFDTAPHYGVGLSEQRLGAFLREQPRDEFLVSTKIGRLLVPNPAGEQADTQGFVVRTPLLRQFDFSREGVLRSIEDSLERMGLDRIDVVFVHDPAEHYREAMDGAFPALDELRAQGVIGSYGAGMNRSAMLADFVRNTNLDVVMCAGRYSLLEQGPLDDLLPAALEHDVSVVAAAVFNSGLLATDRPAADATYDYNPAPNELITRVIALAEACEAHGVSLPAAAVQFPLGHPAVAAVCIGAVSAEQVERNAALFDVDIPTALWRDLAAAGLIRADAPTPG
jgi:D-threo-aldose 1-dehydrogenase